MPDREKVIKRAERIMCSTVDRDIIDSFCEDVIALLEDRAKDYEAWAKEIGVDTCVNCRHASWNRNDGTSTCPIEHNFALVKDGYCHLFIRLEGTEKHGYPERNVSDREAGDGVPGGDDPVLDGPAME